MCHQLWCLVLPQSLLHDPSRWCPPRSQPFWQHQVHTHQSFKNEVIKQNQKAIGVGKSFKKVFHFSTLMRAKRATFIFKVKMAKNVWIKTLKNICTFELKYSVRIRLIYRLFTLRKLVLCFLFLSQRFCPIRLSPWFLSISCGLCVKRVVVAISIEGELWILTIKMVCNVISRESLACELLLSSAAIHPKLN